MWLFVHTPLLFLLLSHPMYCLLSTGTTEAGITKAGMGEDPAARTQHPPSRLAVVQQQQQQVVEVEVASHQQQQQQEVASCGVC